MRGLGRTRRIRRDSLRDVGLRKLYESLATGRMVAFVGSMATRSVNKGWSEIIEDYIKALESQHVPDAEVGSRTTGTPYGLERSESALSEGVTRDVDNERQALVDAVRASTSDDPLKLDIIETLLNVSRDTAGHQDRYDAAREAFAEEFEPQPSVDSLTSRNDICGALMRDLPIKRFLTLNYNAELEVAALEIMAGANRKKAVEKWEAALHNAAEDDPTEVRYDTLDGRRLVSQIIDRDRSERLMSFALGVPERQINVLHLHGRYDQPKSMIVSKRDYRELYWRSGLRKPPIEHGLKAIFRGNPILFVGIGMTEDDVMRNFDQFMSDTPQPLDFPRFVLWSSHDKAKDRPSLKDKNGIQLPGRVSRDDADMAFRLRMFHRFGVYVIYDTDVGVPPCNHVGRPTKLVSIGKCPSHTERVVSTIRAIRINRNTIRQTRPFGEGKGFCRFTHHRKPAEPDDTDKAYNLKPKTTLWMNSIGEKNVPDITPEIRDAILQDASPLTVIVGGPSVGKGTIARALHAAVGKESESGGASVLINAAFAIDSDGIGTVLGSLGRDDYGVRTGESPFDMKISRTRAIEKLLFESELDGDEVQGVTIIINGMGRFHSETGRPLSLELDNFIRTFLRHHSECGAEGKTSHHHRLVLIGTSRVSRYVNALEPNCSRTLVASVLGPDSEIPKTILLEPIKPSDAGNGKSGDKNVIDIPGVRSTPYLELLLENTRKRAEDETSDIGKLVIERYKTIDKKPLTVRRGYRRRVLEIALSHQALSLGSKKYPKPNAELCQEILHTLAFIGQPVEPHVLRHTGGRRGNTLSKATKKDFNDAIAFLREQKLLLGIATFDRRGDGDDKPDRIALHKSVLAEIRENFGVPVSDARLTNSFNLTLYASQPVDSYAPEERWHGNLLSLAGSLIHAFKDDCTVADTVKDGVASVREEIEAEFAKLTPVSTDIQGKHIPNLVSRETSDCLRAAYALMRSYYSIPALLMSMTTRGRQDASLKRLGRRLGELLAIAEHYTAARNVLVREKPELEADLGTPPFFPDDLVWIHNEIGVIELILGRLYRAQRAFASALLYNKEGVEMGERLQNWRRIVTNRLHVQLERGRIEEMNSSLIDLRTVLEDHVTRFSLPLRGKPGDEGPSRLTVRDIIRDYTERNELATNSVNPRVPFDLVLNIAIYLGYRGIAETLRGSFQNALVYYHESTSMLQALGERRAYAFFQRHHAGTLRSLERFDDAIATLELSIHASGAIRQSDINHQARAARISIKTRTEKRPPRDAIPELEASLAFARDNNLYRLQADIFSRLADVHRSNNDINAAMAADTDAMALSARFGHGLRKVDLRRALASTYSAVNTSEFHQSALRLVGDAIRIGTKIGYTTCVERSHNLRVELERGEALRPSPRP